MSFKSSIKRSKSCGGADFFRYDGAVKIRPQTNVVLAELLKQIVELPNHQVDRCVGAHMTVAAQEASRKIQSYHAPAFANGIQLTVCEIARRWAQGVCVGMGRYKWSFRELCDIKESLFGNMREIDHDLQVVTSLDEAPARCSQAIAKIGAGGEVERHSAAKDVVSTPDRSERAQARGIENLKQMQILINRIRALEMKDHCEGMTIDCRLNF